MAITKVITPDLIDLPTTISSVETNTDGVVLAKGSTIAQNLTVDYLVIAGGGGGGGNNSGGGGAGGYLTSYDSDPSGDNSATLTALSLSTGTNYDVTVGAGGAAQSDNSIQYGYDGGASSWADGTNTITGSGGTGGTASTQYTDIAGGAASGGDINIPGAIGGCGSYADGASHGSMFGFGSQRAWTGETHLPNAVGYGGGGAGAYSTTSGSGAGGIIIVWEYK